MPRKSCVPKETPEFHDEVPLLLIPPANLGVAETEGEPEPPGPPFNRPLTVNA